MDVLTSFGVDWKLLIASAINFVILLYLLNKILYQPLLSTLDQRKKTIEESLKNAETIERKLKETEENEKTILHQARLEAERMIAKAEKQAVGRQQELIDHAHDQARQIINQAEAKIARQSVEMRQEIKEHLAEMVLLATRTILQEKTPTEINKQYVEATLKSVEKIKQ